MKVIVYKPNSCEYLFVADNLEWYPGSGRLSFTHDGKRYYTKRPYSPSMLTDAYYDKRISFEYWMVTEEPIVDAEPVTRCRDCIFGERMDGTIYCNMICRNVNPDFYCAEGYCHCGAKMDEEEEHEAD